MPVCHLATNGSQLRRAHVREAGLSHGTVHLPKKRKKTPTRRQTGKNISCLGAEGFTTTFQAQLSASTSRGVDGCSPQTRRHWSPSAPHSQGPLSTDCLLGLGVSPLERSYRVTQGNHLLSKSDPWGAE